MKSNAINTILLLAAAVLLLPSASRPAVAQEFNEVQIVINPQLSIERARRLRHVVRDIAGKRLAPVPGGGETGSSVITPSGHIIVPTADVSAAQTSQGWNLWLDGSGGYLENTQTAREYSGYQVSISAGADTQVTEKLTVGLIVNHNATDIDNTFLPGTSTTSTWGIGPYAAYLLTDTLVLSGSFLYNWTNNDSNSGGVTAAYDAESWSFNTNLTSYHFIDQWTLAPTLGVSVTKDMDDAYVDSAASPFAASTSRTGTFSFGGTATYTHTAENGTTIAPYVSAEGEWTFLNSVSTMAGLTEDSRDFDVNVSAGADFQLSQSLSMSLSSTVSGLAKPDYLSVVGAGRISLSF